MSKLCAAAALVVTLFAGFAYAESQPTPPVSWRDCFSPELRLIVSDEGVRIGGYVEIAATGKCALAIFEAKDKAVFKLHIAGVPIPSLPVSKREGRCFGVSTEDRKKMACDVVAASDLILMLSLTRDVNDSENRRAWTTVLQRVGGSKYVESIALALDDAPAVEAASKPVSFAIGVIGRGPWILAGTAFVFGLVLWWLGRVGALYDRRDKSQQTLPAPTYSLARTQMALWSLVVTLSFVGIYFSTGALEAMNTQVLILLGISSTTGLGSVLIGDTKLVVAQQKAAVQDGTRTALKRFLFDILSDSDGNISVHRFQSLLWTVVLVCVFVYTVVSTLTMPEFSATLLTLLGISNGTYLGFKFADNK